LKIGKLSRGAGYCDFVSTSFRDTPLAGAEPPSKRHRWSRRCKDCDARWTIAEPVFTCKTCNSGSLEILSGRRTDIVSIEIAEEGAMKPVEDKTGREVKVVSRVLAVNERMAEQKPAAVCRKGSS
jgi:hydrogenase nickel incorporation protein HypA/HybF